MSLLTVNSGPEIAYRRLLASGLSVDRALAAVVLMKFDPSQPRVPAGGPEGGQWTGEGGGAGGGGAEGGAAVSGKYLGANSLSQPERRAWAKSLQDGMEHLEKVEGAQRALLHKKLLAAGGHGVGIQEDVDMALVNDHGQIHTNSVVAGPGLNGYCHWNVAALYRKGEVDAIGTGYVLDSDKMAWRQHSWGFRRDKIVETTPANMGAAGYFGVRLTRQEAKAFTKKIGPLP